MRITTLCYNILSIVFKLDIKIIYKNEIKSYSNNY